MKYSPGFIQETLKIIINNLNDDREYLGLQLALAQGIISEKLFERECSVYLARNKFPHNDLVERAKVLHKLIGDRLDAEVIRTSFRCTIEEARLVFEDIQNGK